MSATVCQGIAYLMEKNVGACLVTDQTEELVISIVYGINGDKGRYH